MNTELPRNKRAIGKLFEVGPDSPTPNPSNSAPTDADCARDGIRPLLRQVSPSGMNLLVLSYQKSPDSWLRDWQQHTERLPQELGFVRIGATTRGSGTIDGPTRKPKSPSPVETLTSPADLLGLKEHIRTYLDRWAKNGHRTVVFLDSLESLLQSVGLVDAHAFLHALTNRIRSVGGYGYYQLQSKTDNPEIVDLLVELTDNQINLDDPATRTVYP